MIYYEWRKVFGNRVILCVLGFLLLLNGVCTVYSARRIRENGTSLTETAAVAREWSGMSVEEALDYIDGEIGKYYAAVLAGEPVSEEAFLRNEILSDEQARLKELADYDAYLDEICASAQALSQTGLFGGSDTFTGKTVGKTKQAYEQLSADGFCADVPYGMDLVIGSNWTEYILLLTEIAFALLFFLQEQETGMLSLLRSKPAGREKTAAAKLAALWTASAVNCFLFYGCNFLLAWKLVGLGSLSRPVQTLTDFYTCPFGIAAGTYLLLFLAFRILVEIAVGTGFAWLCTLLKNSRLSVMAIVLVYTVQLLLFRYGDSLPKYFNSAALRNVNVFFSDYRCLNLLGIPVEILTVGLSAVLLLLVGGGTGVLVCYAGSWTAAGGTICRKKYGACKAAAGKKQKSMQLSDSVTAFELRKLLIFRGGALLALTLLLLQSLFWGNMLFRTTLETFYYRGYAAEFSGVLTEQTDERIAEEADRLDTSDEEMTLYEALQDGTITEEYYAYALERLKPDVFQVNAFERIKSQYERLRQLSEETPSIELIDITGWDALLGKAGLESNLICLLTVFLSEILLFCGYGVYERATGVDLLITASCAGHRAVYRSKGHVVAGQSVLLAVFGFFPRWFRISMYYGLDGFSAPAAGFVFRALPGWFGMAGLLCVAGLFILILCTVVGSLIWKLSQRFSSVYSAMFVSSVCFMLPVVIWLMFLG